jgi:hypothetical protein
MTLCSGHTFGAQKLSESTHQLPENWLRYGGGASTHRGSKHSVRLLSFREYTVLYPRVGLAEVEGFLLKSSTREWILKDISNLGDMIRWHYGQITAQHSGLKQ